MGFSRQEYWSGLPCLLQGIFPTHGSNPGLLHCRWILYQLSSLKVKVAQVFPTLCDSMDCSPPASSVHGILQARILESVAMPNMTNPDCGTFCKTTDLGTSLIINSQKLCPSSIKRSCCCLVAQLCPTLCDPMDCSPPGSSCPWDSPARILEGVAISFSIF